VSLSMCVSPCVCVSVCVFLSLRVDICLSQYVCVSLSVCVSVCFVLTLLQYSCLENPMDGGAWWAAVHGVARSWTRLSNLAHTHKYRVGSQLGE